MLFSSATYLFAFLPLSLIAFYLIAAMSRDAAKVFLIAASLFFYSWASMRFLPLLAGSVIINYFLGRMIMRSYRRADQVRVALLRNSGVIGNLALLIYFKYTNFFIDNINVITGAHFPVLNIILPLGISFFTFQRIAYLIDCARGEITGGRFVDFAAISVFFPQLISGPIVLYGEAKPQFESTCLGSRASRDLTVGLVIFAIGLFKKVVLADNAGYACDPVFDVVQHGGSLGAGAAWIGVLAYTVQLYFDFSGYSDMAIGSARMFGIRLPLNFHSPLRASSIIEYWRRWHMTLNRFMVRYVLQVLSLGLTRAAIASRLGPQVTFLTSVVLPVFLTFVIIGAWHGASWTYVLFGVLHATYVSINEIWRNAQKRRRKRQGRRGAQETPAIAERAFAHVLTIACVLAANVMFRSDTVATAFGFYKAMLGLGQNTEFTALYRPELLLFVVTGWFVIIFLPNTQQIMTAYRPAVNWNQWKRVALPSWAQSIVWRPNRLGLAASGAVLAASITALIIEMSREPAQFIYFSSKSKPGLGLRWNFLPLLVIAGWTITGLAAVDTFISIMLDYPSDPKIVPSRLQAFFEYGRSTEGALVRMTRTERSRTAPITLAGWYEPLVSKGFREQQAPFTTSQPAKPVVTIYGGSHSVRLALALGRVSKHLAWRSIGAPGATPNWSYGAFLRDQRDYKKSAAVVLTFNTNLLPAITSFSPAMWNNDSPMPYTADRFYLNGGRLKVMHPPYASFEEYERTFADPKDWPRAVKFFADNDPLFDSISFRSSAFDRSTLVRLARRAYNTDRHKKIEQAVLDKSTFHPNSEAIKVARAIIRDFAARARADGKIPVIYLVNNLGYSDVLFRALKPALDADAVPYVSSHQFVSPSDSNGYLPDSHFTDANDDRLAVGLEKVVMKSR